MRVLICTHHFHAWAGSELVALELVEEFRRRGDTVKMFTPFLEPRFVFKTLGDAAQCINDEKQIDLREFDLVIVLHQTASRFLPFQDLEHLLSDKRPVFAYFHLSPYEPFEAPGVFAQPMLGDMVYANSEETRNALNAYGIDDVHLFENPAPSTFVVPSKPSAELKRLLWVTNHAPKELEDAVEIIREKGVETYRIGGPDNPRRLQAYDLNDHDAVMTIGKTVQCAFRAQRPVFCYDIFQGPGWLAGDTRADRAANFSGRSHKVKRSAEVLADEILEGYANAREWSLNDPTPNSDAFKLEYHVDQIVERARALKRMPITQPVETVRHQLRKEKATFDVIDRQYETITQILSPGVPRWLAPSADHPSISSHLLREPEADEAMIVAAFSFRYDAHLVPGLIENLKDAIHGYVMFDDTNADESNAFTDETHRQVALFEAASEMGADWLFAVDPDERFEDRLAEEITSMTTKYGPVIWSFECREMFDPEHYRIDGLWSKRARARLFPCIKGMEPDQQQFHGNWTRNGLELPIRHSGLNFYHLRMASPARRSLRRNQYAALDPNRDSQALGYDYLDDDRGMKLRKIPESRKYSPSYEEDDALWASPILAGADETVPSDPIQSQLLRMRENWAKGGYAAAKHLACDILEDRPEDQELSLWAADCALRSEDWQTAARLAERVALADRESLMARLILSQAKLALGEEKAAKAALKEAETLCPGSLMCARAREAFYPVPKRYSRSKAEWRRWIPGKAEIFEGRQIADCELTVVVISLGAPPELAQAVASLLNQSVIPEIVVVNSGGGDVRGRLSEYRDNLRIITTNERLYAGAARNVGIDASSGKYVAFLASDCIANDGNTETRLDLHRAGARAVSAYVLAQDSNSICQNVAALLLHATRNPVAGRLAQQKYSLSYERALFDEFGYFPTGVRIGEDTHVNDAVAASVEIIADERITIQHHYATEKQDLFEDIAKRSRRRVRHLFFGTVPTQQELRQRVNDGFDTRLRQSLRALEIRQHEFPAESLEDMRQLLVETLMVERDSAFEEGLVLVRARELQQEAIAASPTDRTKALALIREALDLLPGNFALWQTYGHILLQSKFAVRREEAMTVLRKAAAINPSNATLLMKLMDALIEDGDMKSAVEQFELGCLFAPREPAIWARHAPLPGDPNRPMRVYSLQRMFFLNPHDRSIAETLAENYRHAGNTAARNARLRMLNEINTD